MSTPENTFLRAVNKLVDPSVYHVKMNNPYTAGIPDCWYSGPDGDLWAEFKYLVLPKRPTTMVSLTTGANPALSVLQQQWLHARCSEGRRVCVIVGLGRTGVILPDLAWTKPRTASEFLARAVDRRSIAEWINQQVLR